MASAAFGCILTEGNDMEARIARQCEAVLVRSCNCCDDDCESCYVLSCVRVKHPDGELHLDIDGIEWREAMSRG